jgi:hypothetical protein
VSICKGILAAGTAAALSLGTAFGQAAKEPYVPGLVEFMLTTQVHHSKLWLAGNARNWELADYQLDELKEGLEDVVKRVPDYKGVPVGAMVENLVMPPLAEVESAVKAKDHKKFVAAYDKVTAACNACHVGANRPFIVIVRPSAASFPNQSFAPRKQ